MIPACQCPNTWQKTTQNPLNLNYFYEQLCKYIYFTNEIIRYTGRQDNMTKKQHNSDTVERHAKVPHTVVITLFACVQEDKRKIYNSGSKL